MSSSLILSARQVPCTLVEPFLGSICAASGAVVERTSRETGDAGTLDGDFVITLASTWHGAAGARIVVEARNRRFSLRELRKDLADARHNRDAAASVAIYAPGHLPTGYGPITLNDSSVIAEFNPDEPVDVGVLELGVGVARVLVAAPTEGASSFDSTKVRAPVRTISAQVDGFRAIQVKATSIGAAAKDIKTGLKATGESILESIAAIEDALGW